jgi:hypothetical protein
MATIRMKDKAISAVTAGTWLWATNNLSVDAPCTPQSIADFTFSSASKTTDNLNQGSTNKYYADSLVGTFLSGGTAKTLANVTEITANIGGVNSLVVGDATAIGTPENGLLRMNGSLFEYHNGTTYINPLARANHTGTQLATTISDFNSSARTALAAASNDCLLGSTYALLTAGSVSVGQVNFAVYNPTGRLWCGFKLQSNAYVSYEIPAANGNVSFAALTAQSLFVGTSDSLDSCAIAEFYSTTKGWLKPRMTTLQRLAIASPVVGLEVYDTTLLANCTYNGTQWVVETGGGGSVTGSTNQVGYFTAANVVGGSSNFTYNGSTLALTDANMTVNKIGGPANIEIATFSSNPDSTYNASLAIDNKTTANWKSFLAYKNNTTVKFRAGIDYLSSGTNNYFIEDATASGGAGAVRFMIDANGALCNGGFTADASACLELQSTNKGMLIPRIALASFPVTRPNGWMAYDSTNGYFWAQAASDLKLFALLETTGTAGRIPFYTSAATLDSSARIEWNSTNSALGINLSETLPSATTPTYPLDVFSTVSSGLATVARFSSAPGLTASSRNSIVLENKTSGNKSSHIIFQQNGTAYWSIGNDYDINGSQDFFLYDYANNKTRMMITTSAWRPGASAADNNLLDLGTSGVRFKDVYYAGSLNPSDTRIKKDITTEILGTSQYSMSAQFSCVTDAVKALSAHVIRYKLIDDQQGLDIIGFDAKALYEARFPGARAFKNDRPIKFADYTSEEEVDIFMLEQTQLSPLLYAAVGKIIERCESAEARLALLEAA